MSHHGPDDPIGRWWMSPRVVSTIAVLIVLVVGLVGVALWQSRSPDGLERAVPKPSQTPSATLSAGPGPLPSTAASGAPQTSAPGGGQSAAVPGHSTKPVITGFAVTINGLIVTVSFTFTAQADRGPFMCSIRRASGTDEFGCDVGNVSRTYDYDSCCGSEVYVIATDRHGVRSEQWDGVIEIPRPEPPTFSNLHAWHVDGTVFVEFSVASAPGDDPTCDIDIWEFLFSDPVYTIDGLDCEFAGAVFFDGAPDTYHVAIRISSDSHWNAALPNPQPVTAA